MAHGQVEVGGQPKGLRLLCVLIREARLVFQPGHNLLVLQHSLLVLAFLQGGRLSGPRLSQPVDASDPGA